MTERIRLDDLTSDQLDQLYGHLDQLQADAATCQAQQWPQRLATAETQLAQALTNLDHVLRRARRAEHLRDQYADLAQDILDVGQYTGDRIAGWRKRLDQIGGQTAAGAAATEATDTTKEN